MRFIDKHIVHCSDSKFGDVRTIRDWHKRKGWKDIGYHFVIRRDGEIELGRPLNEIGAHCKGENTRSIGTCLVGVDDFTEKQFMALNKLQHMLASLFPDMVTYGHKEFNVRKTCPNFDVKEVIQ